MLVARSTFAALALCAIVSTAALPATYFDDAYPTSFPYENEVYVPPSLPRGHGDIYDKPDPLNVILDTETFDETDIGGYGARVERCDPTVWAPYNVVQCGYNRYWGFHVLGESSLPPSGFFNCTNRDYPPEEKYWKSSDFAGKVSTFTVCSECCKEYYGLDKFNTGTTNRESQLDLHFTTGMCSSITEEAYCALVDDSQHVCTDNFLSKVLRKRIEMCSDTVVLFFMGCPIFANEGIGEFIKNSEPAAYIEKLTPDMTMLIYSFWKCTDRVCYPHSYYHPEDVKMETGTPAVATPVTSTSKAPAAEAPTTSDDSSSAIAFTSGLVLVLGLTL